MNAIPNDILIPKGFLTQIVLKLIDSYPIIKSFIPDMDTFMNNLQEGENIFNRMTAIDSSNMTQEQKVQEIQKMLPPGTLSAEDVLDLLSKLNGIMSMYKQNIQGSFWNKIEDQERLRKYGVSEMGSVNDYRKTYEYASSSVQSNIPAPSGEQLYNAYKRQFEPEPEPEMNIDIDINLFNDLKLKSDTGEEIPLNCPRARELIRMYAQKCIYRLQYGGTKKTTSTSTSTSTKKTSAPAPAPAPALNLHLHLHLHQRLNLHLHQHLHQRLNLHLHQRLLHQQPQKQVQAAQVSQIS